VTKILTFVEENHSLTQMQSGMPYVYSQAQQYGYADNWTAIRHPSLPNYLALAGGSTAGVTDDSAPSVHPVSGRNVFGAAISAGKSAKSYQESMKSNCGLTSTSPYAVKHNPWAYYTQDRTNCSKFDVPSGTSTSGNLHNDIVAGTLPNVGQVTPNLNNDAHDGSLATADAWMKGWLTLVYASPDWRAGRLAVVITADEDNGTMGNKVLTVVLHQSQSHHIVTSGLTHYSWTKAMTDVSGSACIGAGCNASNMISAFNLPV
jgi:acid phosphatase